MASTDSEIKLIISGDTAALESALSGLNSQFSKSADQADKLWKSFDGAKDVAGKMSAIQDVIGHYKDTLSGLKGQLKDAEDEMENYVQKQKEMGIEVGDDDPKMKQFKETIKALSTEIENNERQLENAEDEYKKLGDTADEESGKLGGAFDKIKDKAGALPAALSGIAAGIGIAIGSKAVDLITAPFIKAFDMIIDGAKKVGQLVGSVILPNFGEIDKALGGYSQLVTAMGIMSGATKVTGESLQKAKDDAKAFTDSVRNVSNATGLSGSTLKQWGTMFLGIGMSAKDSGTLVNSLATVLKGFGTNAETASQLVSQLAQSLGTGQLQFQDYKSMSQQLPGFDKIMTDSMRKLAEQNKLVSSTGKNVSEDFKKATDGGKTLYTAIQGQNGLKIGVKELSDSMKVASENDWLKRQSTQVTSFTDLIDRAKNRIENSWNAAFAGDAMQQQLQKFSGYVNSVIDEIAKKITGTNWGELGTAFLEGFTGNKGGLSLTDIKGMVDDIWDGLFNKKNAANIGEVVGGITTAIGDLVKLMPGLVDTLSQIFDGFVNIAEKIGLLPNGVKEWNDSMKLAVNATEGVPTAFDAAITKLDKLKIKTDGLSKEKIIDISDAMRDLVNLDTKLSGMYNSIGTNSKKSQEAMQGIFKGLDPFIKDLADKLGVTTDQVKEDFRAAFNDAKASGKSFQDALESAINKSIANSKSLGKGLSDSIGGGTKEGTAQADRYLQGFITQTRPPITTKVTADTSSATASINSFAGWASNTINNIVSGIGHAISSAAGSQKSFNASAPNMSLSNSSGSRSAGARSAPAVEVNISTLATDARQAATIISNEISRRKLL